MRGAAQGQRAEGRPYRDPCKTIVSTRLKRAGARWKTPGGQAIMHLRALAKSTRWDDGMEFLLGTYRRELIAERVAA